MEVPGKYVVNLGKNVDVPGKRVKVPRKNVDVPEKKSSAGVNYFSAGK